MPDTKDILFDLLWELSDRSYEAGFPDVSRKLEEAMDTYLAECQLTNSVRPVARHRRGQTAAQRAKQHAERRKEQSRKTVTFGTRRKLIRVDGPPAGQSLGALQRGDL